MVFQERKRLSKPFVVFYTIIAFFFALDFGFVKYKSTKWKMFFRIVRIIQALIISFICISSYIHLMNLFFLMRYSSDFVLYIIFVCSCNFSESYSLSAFLISLTNTDSKLGVVQGCRLESKMLITFLLIALSNLIPHFLYCGFTEHFCKHFGWGSFIISLNFVPDFSIDVCIVVYCFVFYSVLCRLRCLTEITRGCMDVDNMQNIYTSLVSDLERVKQRFDLIFSATLLFNITFVLMTIYYSLSKIRFMDDEKTLNYLVLYITLIKALLLTFAPGLVAQKLGFETEKIRIILHDRLLQERGKQHTQNIKRFIKYIEARPMKFYVFNVIPLNSSLIYATLDFCITYIIVIIQLTHLY